MQTDAPMMQQPSKLIPLAGEYESCARIRAGHCHPTVGQLSRSQEWFHPPTSSRGRVVMGSRAIRLSPAQIFQTYACSHYPPLTYATQAHPGASHSTAPPLPVPHTYTRTTSHTPASNATHPYLDPDPPNALARAVYAFSPQPQPTLYLRLSHTNIKLLTLCEGCSQVN